MFTKLIASLKTKRRKLVFTEGTDSRILNAAQRLVQDDLLTPVLLGNRQAIQAAAARYECSLEGMELIDPAEFPELDAMVDKMVELRKGKMDAAACREALLQPNYFGTMLVKMNYVHGLLGGATYSTADTVRPALQIIKTKPECSIVSSSFILRRPTYKGDETYVMGDCAINLTPSSEDLVEIVIETAKTARYFGIEPKVALLSYSTLGSAKGPSVDVVHTAANTLKSTALDFPVDGEFQFDAAFAEEVAQIKAPGSPVAGQANTFIFPDINTGNIGYKIAQRLGGFEAIGPILQGLNGSVNDLSRGCNAEEVYKMAIITAAMG